mmetsp:Transcript_15355/g.42921  ORF Transcript_15355/g.42921 Transcript_15355/m.42921 type:complete len:326 (+) Transcript_15355:234-1211(+)|eukprot:CAMPEP_0117683170 /NCGR_PEP_ID=MMETSP0804-20121206/20206_1 /TAXON_ID=1074897 /ORGANISM="Tetraselmis astigmatica, Strain CCMP880" /LENGTH=325 /DNA_ID=CAMNT_0005493643 /DNA_START=147 /DNA_END=1124 /DNA_ORIENTATION=-
MDPHAAYAAYPADPYGQHYAADPNAAAAAAHAGYPPAGSAYPGYSAHPAQAGAAAPSPYGEEIRTVFISGFPADVKERELNNLLRFLPGYEASQMHWKNNQAQGFALFVNGPTARGCRDAIQNLCFDDTAVLRCEMAHKNMYFKDADPTAKRPKHAAPAPGYEQYGAYPGYSYPPPAQPAAYQQMTNTKDNPPCNTLFIGNLGDHVNEVELRALFSHLPGFSQLKMVRNSRSTTCFVEFTDVASAMLVHQSQQGAILQSSDRGGIRIQYSKNPFGKKRDALGQLVSLKSGEVTAEPPMHSLEGAAAMPGPPAGTYDPAAPEQPSV